MTTAVCAARRDGSPHRERLSRPCCAIRPARRAGPTIFALRLAVKLWYHYANSTCQEVIFNGYKEEKRWKNLSATPLGGRRKPLVSPGLALWLLQPAHSFRWTRRHCASRGRRRRRSRSRLGRAGLTTSCSSRTARWTAARTSTPGTRSRRSQTSRPTRPPTSTRSPPRCATAVTCASSSCRPSASTWRRNTSPSPPPARSASTRALRRIATGASISASGRARLSKTTRPSSARAGAASSISSSCRTTAERSSGSTAIRTTPSARRRRTPTTGCSSTPTTI